MNAPYAEIYLDYTRPLVQDNILTYKINNSASRSVRGHIRRSMRRLNSEIGLRLQPVRTRREADVLINYTSDLPTHVVGMADVIDGKWWVQLGKGGLAAIHGPTASTIALHEFGHVLGLNHHDDHGLMSISIVGASPYFSQAELNTLQFLWGQPL